MTDDDGQNTISPNMVPSHTKYFKLKEFKKITEGHSDLPHLSMETDHKSSGERCHSLYLQESNIFISEDKIMPKESKQIDVAELLFITVTSLRVVQHGCPSFTKA